MKIQTLQLQNFKAFKSCQRLDFEGKNVLVFGNNGSGKSSIYWALHVFLQSSVPGKDWKKYFTPGHSQSLLNIYADPTNEPPYLRLGLGESKDSQTFHQLSNPPVPDFLSTDTPAIRQADLASDFLNHRIVFNFSNFRHSQDANVWKLFEQDIFPAWIFDAGTRRTFEQEFSGIWELYHELISHRHQAGISGRRMGITVRSPRYKDLVRRVEEFNNQFWNVSLRELSPGIKKILDDYFLKDDPAPFEVEFDFRTPLRFVGKWELTQPELLLKIHRNGKLVERPHTFLNEARMTALALAIRLAMLTNKYRGVAGRNDLKVLLLDDLLISLDMSNRMKVINFLREGDWFKDYQLIILTHDKGFFEILKQNLASDQKRWKWLELYESVGKVNQPEDYINPICLEDVCSLKKAEWYLNGKNDKGNPFPKDLEAVALYLRKKTEELVRIYFDPTLEELARFKVLKTLFASLDAIPRDVDGKLNMYFHKIFKKEGVTEEWFQKLKTLQLDKSATLPLEERKLNGTINKFKDDVFKYIQAYFLERVAWDRHCEDLKAIAAELNEIRGRILNKGAHVDDDPLFEEELRVAITKVREFQRNVLAI